MLTTRRARLQERRGVALILILGMLGLLALIGVTFATFSGQARVGARNYAQAVARPQANDVMDFALSQLIGDTDDVRSAIRGHSMARDMYGNDASRNGYVASNPYNTSTGLLLFTAATLMGPSDPHPGTIQCVTNIPLASTAYPLFYGYDFTRWAVKFGPSNVADGSSERRLVGQTFEVLADDVTGAIHATNHVFYLSPTPPAAMGVRGGYISPDADKASSYTEVISSALIGEAAGGVPTNVGFVLDGRALHAFNGPGMGANAVYGNMRYNGGILRGVPASVEPGEPNVAGMDEDYDACDLENWFLAIQSADGRVIVPSFHRPGVLGMGDWTSMTAQSRSKILRPRAADGHSTLAFPNLRPKRTSGPLPDDADGTINYDVDNDGDGVTDSVWVDLGYPATKDSRGILFKPLFAFMVIGLNGRIPLNTAGNLQQRNSAGDPRFMHASHLGYSPSEVDPTYGLQNAPSRSPNVYSQVDNAGTTVEGDAPISVNVTQLRNILAGVRSDPNVAYGDANIVPLAGVGSYPKIVSNPAGTDQGYPLPNSVFDMGDVANTPRSPLAVPGRWGEAGMIPQVASGTPMFYGNPVRAGLSSLYNPTSQPGVDGMDDNANSLDSWPTILSGERPSGAYPADYYDAAGDFAIAAERIRRFVTPVDLAGDGRLQSFMNSSQLYPDIWGRVAYRKYYRPPGVPVATVSGIPIPVAGSYVTTAGQPSAVDGSGNPVANTAFDVTNNPLHGFESQRNPFMTGIDVREALRYGATPTNLDASGNPVDDGSGNPTVVAGGNNVPTYNNLINTEIANAGLNEADEMSVYQPKTSDQAFGYADLEWLYRAHDRDGASLSSRLADLAPLSFRDSADALRRRRLYSIDVWDTNSIAWANDNVGGAFPNNSRFGWPTTANFSAGAAVATANSGLYTLSKYGGVPYVAASTANKLQSTTPAVAHRDRKINLNFPLPVSNSSTEPTRIKWITETYQYLKTILPPQSLDTPEELAQLSQYLVNIVDFRDPDGTMTRFINPDVLIRPGTPGSAAPSLRLATETTLAAPTDMPLTQHGMEYCPVALNEVLAYSYQTKIGGASSVSRFYVELVNTLSAASGSDASTLNLGGFSFTANDPYAGGCWDLIFTDDDPCFRPDPFTGQLLDLATVPGTVGVYAPLPLNRESFSSANDVKLIPLADAGPPAAAAGTPPRNYYYVIGSDVSASGSDKFPPSTTFPTASGSGTSAVGASLVQGINASYDPMSMATNPTFTIPAGVLPKNLTSTANQYPGRIPQPGGIGANSYKWVCLRRPANPFQAVSGTNPMVVVDAMKFHFIEGTGPLTQSDEDGNPDTIPNENNANRIYSAQRLQPYRGGHLVPTATGSITTPNRPLDVSRYGFTEQILPANVSVTSTGDPRSMTLAALTDTFGVYSLKKDGMTSWPATNKILNTLGQGNWQSSDTIDNNWDAFTFNDRDFTSVAELALVPGCPPGLFTKLFAEFAPISANAPKFTVTRPAAPPPSPTIPALASKFATDPRTYPYLADQLFYSSADDDGSTPWDKIYGPSSGGWYKMFEVFEVPSTASGAVASAANGFNYDWYREDARPGQINLNLIIDEEVFLALVGNAGHANSSSATQQVIVVPPALNGTAITGVDYTGVSAGSANVPLVVTEWDSTTGAPTVLNTSPAQRAAFPPNSVGFATGLLGGGYAVKGAFADFLKIRHGGSGYLFSALPEAPFRSLTFPDINYTIMRPAFPTRNQLATDHVQVGLDAGVKNPALRNTGATAILPPAIPPRRLFQLPDGDPASNASLGGDPYQLGYTPPAVANLNVNQVNLTDTGGTGVLQVQAMHPYWRSEWMQKMMNLSTVRTHQYAVWITVGFFEVTRQGDPAQAWGTDPDSAYDLIGREIGLVGGKNVRQRGFFIVDRLKLDGFDPSNTGKYRDAVVYRRIIQ